MIILIRLIIKQENKMYKKSKIYKPSVRRVKNKKYKIYSSISHQLFKWELDCLRNELLYI